MDIFYTYLLKNKTTGKFYYGVKYGRGADPAKFWVNYFTSSKVVKRLIELYGKEDFEFEIRKAGFKTKFAAREWECKVLRRLKAVQRDDFLNKANGSTEWLNDGGYAHKESTKQKMRELRINETIMHKGGKIERVKRDLVSQKIEEGWTLGYPHSSRLKGKFRLRKDGKILVVDQSEVESLLADGWIRGDGNKSCTGMKTYQTGKLKVRKNCEIKFIDPEQEKEMLEQGWERGDGNKSRKGRFMITNGTENRLVDDSETIPDGWYKGEIKSENFKTPYTTLVSCPHCGKTSNYPIMKRWHFENCKLKVKAE